jgi:hypothetical protein
MKECWVLAYSIGYIEYWNQQDPKPELKEGFLIWANHKYDPRYNNCLRCGAKKT